MSARAGFRTTLDRAGWALAAGGGVGAVLAAAAAILERAGDPLTVLGYAAGGWIGAVAVIALVGAPVWWLIQRRGRRGPVAATLTGAAIGFLLPLGVQTGGFGLDLPPADARTLAVVWTSAVAVAAIGALAGAAVAATMWLVGYRQVG